MVYQFFETINSNHKTTKDLHLVVYLCVFKHPNFELQEVFFLLIWGVNFKTVWVIAQLLKLWVFFAGALAFGEVVSNHTICCAYLTVVV